MTNTTSARRCRIEGLLEGPLPPIHGFAEFLVEWQARLRGVGVDVRVATEGGRFDVHAPTLDVAVPDVGRDPTEVLAAALGELVEKVPAGARARLHSTLRTTDYGGGTQRCTLFALGESGEIVRVEDTTLGEPRALESEPTAQRLHWSFWVAIVLVALILVLSGPRLVERFGLGPAPDAASIAVESAPGGYQLVAVERAVDGDGAWSVVVRHAPDVELWRAPTKDALASDEQLLFRLAERRGHGEIAWRDAAGVLLRVDTLDLAGLAAAAEARVPVAPPPHGTALVRLSW